MNTIAVPDFRDVIENPHAFSSLLEERNALKAEIEEHEQRVKNIDELITAQMTDAGCPKIQYGNVPVSLVQGTRNTIKKERLVELGVPVKTILAATSTTHYTYVLVGKEK